MGLVYCPDCGATVSDRAPACPRCACPIAAPPSYYPEPDPLTQLARAQPTVVQVVAGSRGCPYCGSTRKPVKKSKGSLILAAVLLCIMVLPGILYLMFWSGYVLVCPNCKARLANAH